MSDQQGYDPLLYDAPTRTLHTPGLWNYSAFCGSTSKPQDNPSREFGNQGDEFYDTYHNNSSEDHSNLLHLLSPQFFRIDSPPPTSSHLDETSANPYDNFANQQHGQPSVDLPASPGLEPNLQGSDVAAVVQQDPAAQNQGPYLEPRAQSERSTCQGVQGVKRRRHDPPLECGVHAFLGRATKLRRHVKSWQDFPTNTKVDCCVLFTSNEGGFPSPAQIIELASKHSQRPEDVEAWFQDQCNRPKNQKLRTAVSTPEPDITLPYRKNQRMCVPVLVSESASLLEKDQDKQYPCTNRCGAKFNRLGDWEKHEERNYPQELYHCGDCPSRHKPFFRKDKFRDHVRNVFGKTAVTEERVNRGRISIASEFPKQCIFTACYHKFLSWKDRSKHLRRHFAEEWSIDQWRIFDETDSNGTFQESDSDAEDSEPENSERDDVSDNSQDDDNDFAGPSGSSGPTHGSGSGGPSSEDHTRQDPNHYHDNGPWENIGWNNNGQGNLYTYTANAGMEPSSLTRLIALTPSVPSRLGKESMGNKPIARSKCSSASTSSGPSVFDQAASRLESILETDSVVTRSEKRVPDRVKSSSMGPYANAALQKSFERLLRVGIGSFPGRELNPPASTKIGMGEASFTLQRYLEDNSDWRICVLNGLHLSLSSLVSRRMDGRPSHYPLNATSMLLSGIDSLAGLTFGCTESTLTTVIVPVIAQAPIRPRLLENEAGGAFPAPNLGSPAILFECPFRLIRCFQTFTTFSEWLAHGLSHFGRAGPPNENVCDFCGTWAIEAPAQLSWYIMMSHVATHHKLGQKLADTVPDFRIYNYMYDHGLLNGIDSVNLITANLDLVTAKQMMESHCDSPLTSAHSPLPRPAGNRNANPDKLSAFSSHQPRQMERNISNSCALLGIDRWKAMPIAQINSRFSLPPHICISSI